MWVFVELLNVSGQNKRRLSYAGIATASFLWLSFLLGGYWYVSFYAADKAVILAGPRPTAHTIGMESKEHLFFAVLFLATYLHTVVKDPAVVASRSMRRLALVTAGSVVVLGLVMERLGFIVSLGVRMGLGR